MRGSRRAWMIAGALALAGAAAALAVAVALSAGGGHRRARVNSSPQPTSSSVTAPGPPAQPSPGGLAFGANVNLLLENSEFTVAQQAAGLAELQAAGGTIARTDALWEATEPAAPTGGAHHYDWTFNDRIAEDLATHGLAWLPVIDYSPSWAQSLAGVDHSPPSASADYAAYAAAFAARYGPGGAFWSGHPSLPADPVRVIEIWNEPDNTAFWKPAPDAARYADLYGQARAAIVAAMPSVRVLVGGLTSGGAGRFMSAMLAADPALAGHIDGISIHPYGHTPAIVLERIRSIRATLDRLGLGDVPLYVTEFGWTTSPQGWLDYLPERLRPGYLTSTLEGIGHLDCGIAAVLAYTWVSPQRNPLDGEQWYGIASPVGGPSRDSAAFADGVKAGRGPGAALSC
jgi:hypothetical protein